MGITMPIVKHSFMIQHPLEIPRVIHEAFHIARSGRPGPVVVDIPQDLSRGEIAYEPVLDVSLPGYQPTTEGNQKQIRQAANALAAARRPVIYAGGGVINANAAAELVELATADRFPVTCTLMGLGGFPGHAPAVARDARHARDAHRELRDGRRRPDLRGRRALRRPRHRQARGVRAAARSSSTSTSTRRRSRRTCRRTSRSSATRATCCRGWSPSTGRSRPTRRGSTEWWTADRRAGAPSTRCATRTRTDSRDQAAVHGPGAVRGDRRRGDRRLRRRPAPDVGGPVLPLRPPAPVDQLRRPRARWASACRRRWARRSAAPTTRSA